MTNTIISSTLFENAVTPADLAAGLEVGDYTATDLGLLEAALPDQFVIDEAALTKARWRLAHVPLFATKEAALQAARATLRTRPKQQPHFAASAEASHFSHGSLKANGALPAAILSARKKGLPKHLEQASGALLRSLANRYGFYPADHPLAKYVNRLAKKIANGTEFTPQVLVTKGWDEINALALPDGTMVVTDRLIQFCQYEEELVFVLAHELKHIAREHAVKRMEHWQKSAASGKGLLDLFLESAGQSRFQEYEADIRGNIEMAKQGINPYGGIVFFNRLAQAEAEKDMEHGSPIDRMLNLGVITRLYDLAVLTTDLTPLPAEIKGAIAPHAQTDYLLLTAEGVTEQRGRIEVNTGRQDAVQRAHIPVLLEALPVIAKRLEQQLAKEPKDQLTPLLVHEDQKILSQSLGRIEGHVGRFFSDKTDQEKLFLTAVLIALDTGVDLFAIAQQENPLYKLGERLLEALGTQKDFKTLARLLTLRNLEQINVYISSVGLEPFVVGLARTALEAGIFEKKGGGFASEAYLDFCRSWIKKMAALEVRGGFLHPWNNIFRDLILLALPSLPTEEARLAFLKGVAQSETMVTAYLSAELKRKETPKDEFIEIPNPKAFIQKTEQEGPDWAESALQTLFAVHGLEMAEFLSGLLEDADRLLFWLRCIHSLSPGNSLKKRIDLAHYKAEAAAAAKLTADEIHEVASFLEGYDKEKASEFLDFIIFSYLGARLEDSDKSALFAVFYSLVDRINPTPYQASANEFLNSLFEKHAFDLNDSEDTRFLHRLSFLLADPVLAFRLRDLALQAILAASDEAAAFRFLFEEKLSMQNSTLAFREDYVNRRVNRPDALDRLEAAVLKSLDVEPTAGQGRLVLMDTLEELLRGKRRLFSLLMETSRDDTDLRRLLISAHGVIEHEDELSSLIKMSESDLRSLYAADGLTRHAMVRNLLTGKKGLLTGEADRRWLVEFFLTHFVQPGGDPTLFSILGEGLKAFAQTADLETLYFALAPLFAERILKPPARPPDWKEVLQGTDWSTLEIAEALGSYQQADFEGDGFKIRYYEAPIRRLTGETLPPLSAPVGSAALIREIASKLGSPGVRFLQILGQFIDISGYEAEFSEVYDSLRGQTKLTAWLLLKREWPALASEIAELGEPVGGGSLMTTFRATATDGKQEVVKVLNPNALYHLEIVYRMLGVTFKVLAEQKGGGYALAQNALENIKAWIAQDIRFEGFLEKDSRFFEQNNGWSTAGARYRIKVPHSRGPDNRYFKREEYVEGLNLTQMEALSAQGHDVKGIVSLLVRNYWKQMREGLVHSDVHPGNFRVTAENEVAILDRNFFIELDERDQVFIQVLWTSGGDAERLAGALVDYLAIPPSEFRDNLADQIDALLKSGRGAWEKVQSLVLILKEKGVTVPLKWTLLLKNTNALNRLAQQASFANLFDAVHYPK